MQRMKRHDGRLTIDRKAGRGVVHDRAYPSNNYQYTNLTFDIALTVVIGNFKMGQVVRSIKNKIIFGAGLDIFPHDLHKLIAIVRRVHVMEAKRVDEPAQMTCQ